MTRSIEQSMGTFSKYKMKRCTSSISHQGNSVIFEQDIDDFVHFCIRNFKMQLDNHVNVI